MSDAILLDIASLLHLLTGWEVTVQLLFPCLLFGFPSSSPSSAGSRPEQ